MPRAATLMRIASTIRPALSPGSSRDGARPRVAAASMRSILVFARTRALVDQRMNDGQPGPETTEAPSRGAPERLKPCRRRLRGADRRGRRRRASRGRRRVLELLLGPEQRVQHLRAELLARDQSEAGREREDHDAASDPAALAGVA